MRAVRRSLLLVVASLALVLAVGHLVHHYARLTESYQRMLFF